MNRFSRRCQEEEEYKSTRVVGYTAKAHECNAKTRAQTFEFWLSDWYFQVSRGSSLIKNSNCSSIFEDGTKYRMVTNQLLRIDRKFLLLLVLLHKKPGRPNLGNEKSYWGSAGVKTTRFFVFLDFQKKN